MTIYLLVKDPFESKYQLLINGREKAGIKKLKNLKAFIHCSQTIDNIYKNLGKFNPTKKQKVLIVFDVLYQLWQPLKINSYSY